MNNEFAFPSDELNGDGLMYQQFHGMTLRDYFAAKAMQGILAATTNQVVNLDNIAENAFKMADAMMKARSNV